MFYGNCYFYALVLDQCLLLAATQVWVSESVSQRKNWYQNISYYWWCWLEFFNGLSLILISGNVLQPVDFSTYSGSPLFIMLLLLKFHTITRG